MKKNSHNDSNASALAGRDSKQARPSWRRWDELRMLAHGTGATQAASESPRDKASSG